MRAAWLATVYNIDWPSKNSLSASAMQSELTAILDKMQNANFNAACLQVRPMADALYKSTLEPASAYVAGSRGKSLTWDPLDFFIKECHKRNMEAHAWVNPFRLPYTLSSTIALDKKVADNNWSLAYTRVDSDGKKTNLRIFNPALEDVRNHICQVIKEIVTKYDVDGVMFDDYFYIEGLPLGSGYDYPQYDAYVKAQKAANKTAVSQKEWRRMQVNATVKAVNNAIKSEKPYVRFGIGPAGVAGKSASKYNLPACYKGSDWVYDGIYCDPLAWLSEGSIDYITPQIYWARNHSTNPYEPIAKWWSEVAKHFNRHFFSSQKSQLGGSEMQAQIDINRNHTLTDAPGSVFYNTTNTLSVISSIANKFPYPAAVPEMTWYDNKTAPGVIKSLTKSGSTLTATAVNNSRYVFYAVPSSVSKKDAQSSTHAGLKAEYVLAYSYNNAVTIPSGKATGYWYAAALLDRYGKEWDLVTIDEPASGYKPVSDGNVYDEIGSISNNGNIRLTSSWIRSNLHGNAIDFKLGSTGAENYYRDLAVSTKDGLAYLMEAVTASKTAPVYLRRFVASTGEELDPLKLVLPDAFVNACYSPVNSVMSDGKGNILVSGLKLANSGNLSLGKVDTATGNVTIIATLSDASERIDHTGVYGDADGTLYVFAVGSSSNVAHRWTVTGGKATHNSFNLTAAVGLSPRIHAISATQFFVDSSKNGFELFTWGKGAATASFAQATQLKPRLETDGGVYINYNGVPMICYAAQSANSSHDGAAKFRLAYGPSLPASYSGLQPLWMFPSNEGGMGTIWASNDWGNPVAYLPPSETATESDVTSPGYIIVLSPRNGIAGYKLDVVKQSGVIVAENDIAGNITIGTDVITLPVVAKNISLFNISGMVVETVGNSAEIRKPAVPGVYILTAVTESGTIRKKIEI